MIKATSNKIDISDIKLFGDEKKQILDNIGTSSHLRSQFGTSRWKTQLRLVENERIQEIVMAPQVRNMVEDFFCLMFFSQN